jgi:hypothetical protein
MKLTTKSSNGTSFHGVTIKTSVNELIRVLGNPQNDSNTGKYNVNFEWTCERENGDVVTIYDWKEYRMIDINEEIEFHIGGKTLPITFNAKEDLVKLLND